MSSVPSLPMDVRVMNFTAALLVAGCVLLAVGALGLWALRHPRFAIAGLTVEGEMLHNNAVTLRTQVLPRLSGSFFTVRLDEVRQAFEAVPWVRQAVVQREFPNRLHVTLREHEAAAFWGPDSETRLVSPLGEVFDVNPGDLDDEALPRLNGPIGQAQLVLAMYEILQPQFVPLHNPLRVLELTGRGSWRAELASGTELELGRGTPQEVSARVQRLVQTLEEAAHRYARKVDAVETVDLRHPGGYALRLRGVTTLDATAKNTGRK